jgi:hypothetical protein
VGEVLAYDVAAGRSEDVADEENVHLWILARAEKKQIPKGNDRKKGKDESNGKSENKSENKGKRRSRFPEGMTEERQGQATVKARAVDCRDD